MQAEVISIGDELVSGQRLDTNSSWLSQRLEELGARVVYHTTVGDELEANVRVFRQALERVDLVLCTGGLGPTADDLTREAVAEVTGRKLICDAAALEHIRSLFARRKREMPERNTVQAMFPAGSRVVPNPHGTAPGIDIEVESPAGPRRLFALPGVPAEMQEMWTQTVSPAIARMAGLQRRVVRYRTVRCFGVGESDLEQMLPDLIRRGRSPTVGITASRATLTLRIRAEAESTEACDRLIGPTLATVHDCLGRLVFGEEDDELQDAVIRLLRSRAQTLATAEIGSGGLLSSWLSAADEPSGVFLGGWVARSLADPSRAGADGARPGWAPPWVDSIPPTQDVVSHSLPPLPTGLESAAACADLVRRMFAADLGLAMGPFPPSDSATTTPGDVYVGMARPGKTESRRFPFVGHPDIVKDRAVKMALNCLRLWVLES